MRKSIRQIKFRHEKAADYHCVEVPVSEHDDVSFTEWRIVHDDRAALLAEIERLEKARKNASR